MGLGRGDSLTTHLCTQLSSPGSATDTALMHRLCSVAKYQEQVHNSLQVYTLCKEDAHCWREREREREREEEEEEEEEEERRSRERKLKWGGG